VAMPKARGAAAAPKARGAVAASKARGAAAASKARGAAAASKARGAAAASKARRQLRPGDAQQALQLVMSALAATIIVSVVGLSGFFIIAEERRGPVAESAAPPGVPAAISSREVDGAPLTLGEVFPEGEIRLTREAAPYRITVTHSDTDCRGAATEELGVLVASQGCSQVVRAALVAPLGGYHVTAGIFNLAEAGEAALVSDRAGTLVEAGRGTFAALGEVEATPVQVGWHDRGHYLLYCVIARPDGQVVADDDPFAEQITADLVEHYLGEQILGRRTLDP